LGTEAKNRYFHQFGPDFDDFGFLPQTECSVKYFVFKLGQNSKFWWGFPVFFEKFKSFGLLMNV
jgi:hypothetical protein